MWKNKQRFEFVNNHLKDNKKLEQFQASKNQNNII
jgi:hypothetical protein